MSRLLVAVSMLLSLEVGQDPCVRPGSQIADQAPSKSLAEWIRVSSLGPKIC